MPSREGGFENPLRARGKKKREGRGFEKPLKEEKRNEKAQYRVEVKFIEFWISF
jgi:hypothetical protein